MDEALIAEQDDFHFLVGIGVGLPIVARYVVLKQAPPQMAKYILLPAGAIP